MKKILFLLALGGFLINAPLTVWAMEDDNETENWVSSDEENDKENDENDYTKDFMVGRPCRIRFSSKSFEHDISWAFAKLKKEHFRQVSENDHDESARGKEEIWLDDTEINPLLDELKRAGWIIETSQENFNAKVQEEVANQLSTNSNTAFPDFNAGHNVGITKGRELARQERSIFEKHSKKLIVTAFGVGLAGGVGAMYYFNNRH